MSKDKESWDTVMTNNMYFPYSKMWRQNMVDYEAHLIKFKALKEWMDILIPKLGDSRKDFMLSGLAVAVAVQDFLDSGDDYRLRELLS